MAKSNKLNSVPTDNIFGNSSSLKSKSSTKSNTVKRSVGKPKIIPASFKKVNFMLDEDVIKKLRMRAIEEGESVNLFLNSIISEYLA